MSDKLSEESWETLLPRIQKGKCTPFLGAGVNKDILPLGSVIAEKWAKNFGYPLEDSYDLARVAQYLAVTHDPMFPKEKILEEFRAASHPDFTAADEPHAVMADLPLPVYITTNYDPFMVKALQSRNREPQRELCRWNSLTMKCPSVFDSTTWIGPTVANPLVFHFHGHDEVTESLVLTEGDYLDFLVNISRSVPALIQGALSEATLLFIGYKLADWDFRVLLRGLVHPLEESLRRFNVAVQLPPMPAGSPGRDDAQKYLDRYFGQMRVQVYWGTANEFAAELRERWSKFRS